MTAPVHPAASAYEAQLKIRREGEERSAAQQNLNSWLGELGSKKSSLHQNSSHSKQRKKANVSSTTSNTVEESSAATSFEEERLRGNDFFSKGKYQEAIQCYTHCLGWKEASMTPVVYSNRAMAYLKLKNWTNAEADATTALSIDSNHSKSYQRRCVARLSMGKLRAAMMDACLAEEYLERDDGTKSLDEVRQLQQKVENALVDAVKRAPRRKINVECIKV